MRGKEVGAKSVYEVDDGSFRDTEKKGTYDGFRRGRVDGESSTPETIL